MKTKTKKQREIRNNATAWALMAPALIFMLAFTVFPIFRSLYLSLSKYKLGMDSAEFIGLENYVKLAGSKLFWKVMKNTIVFALMTVIPSMAVGLRPGGSGKPQGQAGGIHPHGLFLPGGYAYDCHCQRVDVHLYGKERSF